MVDRNEASKRDIMGVKMSWLIDGSGLEIYSVLKKENDKWETSSEFCCIVPRHIFDMKWFSEKSKRWLGCMQAPVGVRAQVPVKTFSAAVLPDSSATLLRFLIRLWFAFLKSISLPSGEMHSSIQILRPSHWDWDCTWWSSGKSNLVARNVKKKNPKQKLN